METDELVQADIYQPIRVVKISRVWKVTKKSMERNCQQNKLMVFFPFGVYCSKIKR